MLSGTAYRPIGKNATAVNRDFYDTSCDDETIFGQNLHSIEDCDFMKYYENIVVIF